jgi:hypothetical protein
MWRDFGAGYAQVCCEHEVQPASHSISSPVTLIKLRTASDGPIGGLQVTKSRVLQVVSDVSGSTFPSVTLATGWHTAKLCGSTGASGTWQLVGGRRPGVFVDRATTGRRPSHVSNTGTKARKTFAINVDDVVVTQS